VNESVAKPARVMRQPRKQILRERIAYLESQVDALTQERVGLRLDLVLARRPWWRRLFPRRTT
jgi:hypothetical protein